MSFVSPQSFVPRSGVIVAISTCCFVCSISALRSLSAAIFLATEIPPFGFIFSISFKAATLSFTILAATSRAIDSSPPDCSTRASHAVSTSAFSYKGYPFASFSIRERALSPCFSPSNSLPSPAKCWLSLCVTAGLLSSLKPVCTKDSSCVVVAEAGNSAFCPTLCLFLAYPFLITVAINKVLTQFNRSRSQSTLFPNHLLLTTALYVRFSNTTRLSEASTTTISSIRSCKPSTTFGYFTQI